MNEEVKQESVRIHSRADELIACLEGEIAKRDAIIYAERIDADLQRQELDAANGNLAGMRAELAAIKAQEPVAIEFRQFMTDVVTGAGLLSCGRQSKGLAAELSANAYKYLLGAPVSEAKAQGVVMPERMSLGAATRLGQRFEVRESFCAGANHMHDEFARLNAAPVQQVSVPGGWKLVPVNATEAILDVLYSNGMDESDSLLQDIWSAMLAAAPAADKGVTSHD